MQFLTAGTSSIAVCYRHTSCCRLKRMDDNAGKGKSHYASDFRKSREANGMSTSMAIFFNKYVQRHDESRPSDSVRPLTARQRLMRDSPRETLSAPSQIPLEQRTPKPNGRSMFASADTEVQKKWTRRAAVTASAILLSLCIVGAVGAIVRHVTSPQPDPYPISIRQSVSYPLYYLRKLPHGFILDTVNPPRLLGGVVTIRYLYDGHPIIMNTQARSAALNPPNPFYLQQVATDAGTGYVLNVNNQPTVVIEGNKTITIVASDDKLATSTFIQFIRNLRQAK